MRRPLRGKKFTPQVSREELLKRVSETLKTSGADHHSQASLMYGIAELVVQSTEPAFVALQPHAKLQHSEAWTTAYSVVTSFLSRFRMELTAKAIELESKEKIPTDSMFIKNTNINEYMDKLLAISQALGVIDFGQRVGVFVGEREKAKLKPIKPANLPKKPVSPQNVTQRPAPAPKPLPQKQEKVEPKPIGKPPIPKPASPPKSPVKQDQPFKKPTIHDLSKAPVMMKNLSSDFTDESDVSPRKKEDISVEDFDSDESPKKPDAGADDIGADMDDFVDVSDGGEEAQTNISAHSPVRESDFDGSGVDFEEPESVAKQSDDDVDVDVDVPGDDPIDESSRMMIQLPESSVMEPANGGDSDIDVFVEGDSDIDIVEDFDSD